MLKTADTASGSTYRKRTETNRMFLELCREVVAGGSLGESFAAHDNFREMTVQYGAVGLQVDFDSRLEFKAHEIDATE